MHYFALVAFAFLAEAALPPPAVIVVRFVGGFVHQNDSVHKEVQMADRLRTQYPAAMQVKIFANHEGQQAYKSVLQSLGSALESSTTRS